MACVESHSCRTACLHTMSWKRSWRFACASCARDRSREVVINSAATRRFCRDLEAFFAVRGACVKAFFTRENSASAEIRAVARNDTAVIGSSCQRTCRNHRHTVIARREATKQSISPQATRWMILLRASLRKEESTSSSRRARRSDRFTCQTAGEGVRASSRGAIGPSFAAA